MRIVLIACFVALTPVGAGCGHRCKQQACPEVKPFPCYLCTETREVLETRTCIEKCTTPECRSGCCHTLAFVPGTDEERAALRSCIRECAGAAVR